MRLTVKLYRDMYSAQQPPFGIAALIIMYKKCLHLVSMTYTFDRNSPVPLHENWMVSISGHKMASTLKFPELFTHKPCYTITYL